MNRTTLMCAFMASCMLGSAWADSDDVTANLSAQLSQTQISAMEQAAGLLPLAGTPTCGVRVEHVVYPTLGGHGELTQASAALMVPQGSAAVCQGRRPVVLYAHGTAFEKNYNLADFSSPTHPGFDEALEIAAVYSAQGYVVVAPNYVGYDVSPSSYHPYLNGLQQSQDMIDGLFASKHVLSRLHLPVRASQKLFLTGYSQGGYVAMATQQTMDLLGIPVTASSPGSGPYALAAFVDYMFAGHPDLGSPLLATWLVYGYQNSYYNLYLQPSDLFGSTVAPLVANNESEFNLVANSALPQTALFDSTPPLPILASITPAVTHTAADPIFALGFGEPSLINNNFRAAYLLDATVNPDGLNPATGQGLPSFTAANPIRQDLAFNDLRGYSPNSPTLLCGGVNDPVVFFPVNTGSMQAEWAANPPVAPVGVLNVDANPLAQDDGFNALRAGFQALKQGTIAQKGVAGWVESYHGDVAPFCAAAARGYFSKF